MKKFHVTGKTLLTIAGVALPLAAAVVIVPKLKQGRRERAPRV